jgi:hypothetical protein
VGVTCVLAGLSLSPYKFFITSVRTFYTESTETKDGRIAATLPCLPSGFLAPLSFSAFCSWSIASLRSTESCLPNAATPEPGRSGQRRTRTPHRQFRVTLRRARNQLAGRSTSISCLRGAFPLREESDPRRDRRQSQSRKMAAFEIDGLTGGQSLAGSVLRIRCSQQSGR